MARAVALRRLLSDLKEVLEHPQLDAVALPIEANLFCWHANLRCQEGPLAGVVLHCVLEFTDLYPSEGPQIRVFHALPHPNVSARPAALGSRHGATYRVSLWDCNPSLDQWSPAYSVSSVLALLSSFLFDAELLYVERRISLHAAARAAMTLKVSGHPHTGAAPVPPFPTPEEVALAPRLRMMDVRRPEINKELMLATHAAEPGELATLAVNCDGWTPVDLKRGGVKLEVAAKVAAAGSSTNGVAIPLASASVGCYAALAELGEEAGAEQEQAEAAKSEKATVQAVEEVVQREEKVATVDDEQESVTANPSGSTKNPRRKGLLDPAILKASHRSLVADVMALHRRRLEGQRGEASARLAAHADSIQTVADHKAAAVEGSSAGPAFDRLTPDALAQVLMRVEARDVAALGATCRALRAACSDGEVWRAQLRRSFPASSLRCTQLADYRTAYDLEANGVVPELACFYSKATWDTEFTINPKTRQADYISTNSPDLVAVEAVRSGLVVRDAQGNAIQGVIPAYITADHFKRALPYLPAVLRQLCPDEASPSPERWLTVLPTMLNTCAVLLSDQGVAASERALNTYCGLHRLLLALCDHYQLWEKAERRVQRFLSSEAQQSKSETPSLGHLVPLLAVSRRHNWREVTPVILGESVDRQVLWVCKADRSLVARYKQHPGKGGVDEKLMDGMFQASVVSYRLHMFHAAFLRLVARPDGQSVGEVMYRMDSLYGRPGAGMRRRFQAEVKATLECRGLNEALDVMGISRLSPAAWTARLRQSWLNSLARGYHTARTNFDRVQAGGVSRILLCGQRYSAPPNLSHIEVDERWHSKGSEYSFSFLDASCLLYGWQAEGGMSKPGAAAPPLKLLGYVDYSTQRSKFKDQSGVPAVQHSGDIIDGSCGQHTLSINLKALPLRVRALYLTLSAWMTAQLDDIDQPFVSVRDPASGQELCTFQLDDVPEAQRRKHTSVVMLKIFRGAAPGQWEIEAVGQLGQGCAGFYGPMDEWITSSLVPSSRR
ncbi:Ubiquitin-conjugating enzyme E2 B [Chlorella vulgaris]